MISYGGIYLGVPSDEIASWIGANLSLADALDIDAPSANLARERWTENQEERYSTIKLGTLYWPAGAARWAFGHFLADDAMLAKIRPQAYTSAGLAPLTLKMSDGSAAGQIETSLYLLPPRPLAQIPKYNGLNVLTLVDVRYFWNEASASITVTGGTTTWATLFASIATALGITLTTDTIASAYLKPADSLNGAYANLAELLDRCCASVGHRFVRKLNGTCVTQTAVTAKASQDAMLRAAYAKGAGGNFLFDGRFTPHDLPGHVPATVTLTFPRTDNGVPSATPYTLSTTLTALALAEYGQARGHTGTKTIETTVLAPFTGGGTPTNNTELVTLTTQAATDFYRWKLARVNARYNGVVAWVPSGFDDSIEWTATTGEVSTRIQRPEDERQGDGGRIDVYGAGGSSAGLTVYGNIIATGIINSSGGLIVGSPVSVTDITADQDDYVGNLFFNWWKFTSTGGPFNITGIGKPSPGKIIIIQNDDATDTFYFPHQDSGSSADNRFWFSTKLTLALPPCHTVAFIYGKNSTQQWTPIWWSDTPHWVPNPTPTPITTNQASLDPLGRPIHRIDPDPGLFIYGIKKPWDGAKLTLINDGSPITVNNESGSAGDPTEEIVTPGGLPLTLGTGQTLELLYDSVTDQHVVVGGTAAIEAIAEANGGLTAMAPVSTETTILNQVYLAGDPVNWNDTINVAKDLLHFVPFIPNEDCHLDEMSMSVTTGGTAASVLRFGLWAADAGTGSLYPGTLLWDSGAKAADSTAFLTGTPNLDLTAGTVYWCGYVHNAASAPFVRAFVGTDMGTRYAGVFGTRYSNWSLSHTGSTDRGTQGIRVAFTYGALGTAPTSSPTQLNNSDKFACFGLKFT